MKRFVCAFVLSILPSVYCFAWDGGEKNHQRIYGGAKRYFEKSADAFQRGNPLEAAWFPGGFAHIERTTGKIKLQVQKQMRYNP